MCKSVYMYLSLCFAFKSRAGYYTTLLTAPKLCSAALKTAANNRNSVITGALNNIFCLETALRLLL